jgi:16S rRNA processing protein RimM
MLIVQTDTGEEVLVPFVKAFVKLMDLAARQLTMELPAGLVDVNKKS